MSKVAELKEQQYQKLMAIFFDVDNCIAKILLFILQYKQSKLPR